MSNSFSKNFEIFVDDVANDLGIVGIPENSNSRFNKSAVSSASILAGDVLFFQYRSNKFGSGEHLAMVVGNKRATNGIYNYTTKKGVTKKYLASVKLNSIWHETASIIIEAYRDRQLKYTSYDDDADDPQRFEESDDEKIEESFMALVGRRNYRSYIINNMWNSYKFGDKKEEEEQWLQ